MTGTIANRNADIETGPVRTSAGCRGHPLRSLRAPGGELRVGQRAEEREHATSEPDAQDRPPIRNDRRDESRRREDADTDHVGDDDGRGVYGTKPPREGRAAAGHASHFPFSTGLPLDVHFPNPPITAHASAIPCCRNSSAARALVCSAGQLQ
jgi:hypothetical protein